jgi:hypothetical protein
MGAFNVHQMQSYAINMQSGALICINAHQTVQSNQAHAGIAGREVSDGINGSGGTVLPALMASDCL